MPPGARILGTTRSDEVRISMPSGDSPRFDATLFAHMSPNQPFADWPEKPFSPSDFQFLPSMRLTELKEAGRRGIAREATMRPLSGNA